MKRNLNITEIGTIAKVEEFAKFEMNEDGTTITLTFEPITYHVGSDEPWMAGERPFSEGPPDEAFIDHAEIFMFGIAVNHARELVQKMRKPSKRK